MRLGQCHPLFSAVMLHCKLEENRKEKSHEFWCLLPFQGDSEVWLHCTASESTSLKITALSSILSSYAVVWYSQIFSVAKRRGRAKRLSAALRHCLHCSFVEKDTRRAQFSDLTSHARRRVFQEWMGTKIVSTIICIFIPTGDPGQMGSGAGPEEVEPLL